MTIAQDVQKLEPGPILEFFQVDATSIGGGILRFHNHSDGDVTWQGLVYSQWPIEATGFERTSGQQPRPTLSVGNIDGSISFLCLAYEDMVGAVVTVRTTFKQYLDGQPGADPTQEFLPDIWFIDRKAKETIEAVEFELASALDFADVKLPRRQIIANQCSFVYRGAYCNYTGPAVATALDVATSDMALDRCGKRIGSCKLRQWPDNVLNFGGYPAAGLVRT